VHVRTQARCRRAGQPPRRAVSRPGNTARIIEQRILAPGTHRGAAVALRQRVKEHLGVGQRVRASGPPADRSAAKQQCEECAAAPSAPRRSPRRHPRGPSASIRIRWRRPASASVRAPPLQGRSLLPPGSPRPFQPYPDRFSSVQPGAAAFPSNARPALCRQSRGATVKFPAKYYGHAIPVTGAGLLPQSNGRSRLGRRVAARVHVAPAAGSPLCCGRFNSHEAIRPLAQPPHPQARPSRVRSRPGDQM